MATVLKLRWIEGEKDPIKWAFIDLPQKVADRFIKQHSRMPYPKYVPADHAPRYGIIEVKETKKKIEFVTPEPEAAPEPQQEAESKPKKARSKSETEKE